MASCSSRHTALQGPASRRGCPLYVQQPLHTCFPPALARAQCSVKLSWGGSSTRKPAFPNPHLAQHPKLSTTTTLLLVTCNYVLTSPLCLTYELREGGSCI